MTVRVYQSTDVGAPALSNAAGALIAILDACLVNGYGSYAPAGWTKAFSSSTTGADYQQGSGSNGFYLHVEDALANIARLRGFEAMSAYNTGTGLFPTDVQLSGGSYFSKTDNAAGNQPWLLFATEEAFYFFSAFNRSAINTSGSYFFFGDIPSTKPGDAYNTMLLAQHTATQTTAASNGSTSSHAPYFTWVNVSLSAHHLARAHTQLGSSSPCGKHTELARLGNGVAANLDTYNLTGIPAGSAYPQATDGSLLVSPVWVHEPGNHVRGVLPGLWIPNANPLPAHKDTYTGSGALAGKTLMVVNVAQSQFHMETSDTW